MVKQESAFGIDAWSLAKKRTNAYLKLHGLSEQECQQLMGRILDKLATTSCQQEQELLRLFISSAQQELQQQLSPDDSCCYCWQQSPATPATETRLKTGPQLQRSSIRVAPLRTVPLLRPRQTDRK